ncbi:MarR family winged helix-turn-helix transcriptional regulator [Novosphingobium sp. RL4]|uniref:MarR family winged helix-turn-helix transcriptional regulator n=1 Tax=Novosphingobium sp. RL4 TaxID=3109595 RepID=UPI002D7688B6|nr:MarR family winged helix-turn-helix transcriptional regulator [Novosphingobium sp. RL4]WRT94452.1 MarR family winged helix-turn-helix transcriptional regulator [Novosphingobium sp. RL4]
MNERNREARGEAFTELILGLMRANNVTLTWGDRLVAPFGLTSARWQILGAIALSDQARPVAWIARDLGSNRQNVQRIVNDLNKEGLVTFEPNPHHRRANLVVLTPKGQSAYAAALAEYNPRVNTLANGMTISEIRLASQVLSKLRAKLEQELDAVAPTQAS